MSHKILSVCYHECLPVSVIELLEKAGYLMTCTREVGAALQLLRTHAFDLILINQSVSEREEHLFVHLVRQNTQVPIIFVSGQVQNAPEGVNVWIRPPVQGPQLLSHIERLLPRSSSQSAP